MKEYREPGRLAGFLKGRHTRKANEFFKLTLAHLQMSL